MSYRQNVKVLKVLNVMAVRLSIRHASSIALINLLSGVA